MFKKRNEMFTNIYRLFILAGILAALILSGCTNNTETTSSIPVSSINSTVTSPSSSISNSPAPTAGRAYLFNTTLSKLPRLGETAEMTFMISPNLITSREGIQPTPTGLEKSHAWVEFYWTNIHGSYAEAKTSIPVALEEVVLSGETDWRGSYQKGDNIILKSTIQLPREGIWYIKTFFFGEGWKAPSGGTAIRIASADGIALDMNSQEFKSSSLVYLDNLYGTSSNIAAKDLLSEQNPVVVILDLAKAPKVGEEVAMTCSVYSLHDVTDFTIGLLFDRRTATTYQTNMTGDQLLVKGDLSWHGNLQAGATIDMKAILKFPSDGDWRIRAYGNSKENDIQEKGGYGDNIEFTTSNVKSNFFWPKVTVPSVNRTLVTNPPPARTPSEQYPVVVNLNMAKPPKAGEEVTVTCSIYSMYDFAGCTLQLDFTRRTATTYEDIAGQQLLVKGDIYWRGDLRAGEAVEVKAVLKFPSEGDWSIHAWGNTKFNKDTKLFGYDNLLLFSISGDKSSFEWPFRPDPPGGWIRITLPPPTPTTIPVPSGTYTIPTVAAPTTHSSGN